MSTNNTANQLALFDPIEIPLTRGHVALIDPIDADLAAFKWFSRKNSGVRYYACRLDKNRKTLNMHRVVMERTIGRALLKSELVDHVNNNPLDNRRSNLRIATASQNKGNAKRSIVNKTGVKGVSYIAAARLRPYRALITVRGRCILLGYFGTLKEAADAYAKAAKVYFGEFARVE